MKTYVLCKKHPLIGPHAIAFVCGLDPRMPTFDPTAKPAARFETPEDAVRFRSLMPHQLGGTEAYHVYELLEDGQLIDVE
jgi:hypothetical protein